MSVRRTRWGIAVIAAGCAWAWSGCGFLKPVVDTTKFYVLDVADYATVSEAEGDGLEVVVRDVWVAPYLEASPGIVIRVGDHRIIRSQQHRWAESLEEGIARVLIANLSREPVVAGVSRSGVPGDLPDLDLYLKVMRAEGVMHAGEGNAVLEIHWELRTATDAEIVAEGDLQEREYSWDGRDFNLLVASLSEGIVELSQRIASVLIELRDGRRDGVQPEAY